MTADREVRLPIVENTTPPWCSNAAWSVSLCRTGDRAMALGSVSHSRVEPSMSVNRKVTVPAGDGPGAAVLTTAPAKLSLSRDSKVVGQQPFQLPRRGEGPVGHGAGGADAVDERLQPRLLVRGGRFRYSSMGLPAASRYSSPPGPRRPSLGRPQP